MAKRQKQNRIDERIHGALTQKSAWYAAWHDNANHQIAQWAILVLIALIIGGMFYLKSIAPDSSLQSVQTRADALKQYWADQEYDIQKQTLALLEMAESYKKADEASKSALLGEMVNLARDRSFRVDRAAKERPEAVLNVAIPVQLRAKFPKDLDRFLEEEVSKDGIFDWKVEMEFDAGTKKDRFELHDSRGNKEFELALVGAVAPAAKSGDRVRIKGVRVDKKIIVSNQEASIKVLAATTPPVDYKVAVILVNFRNNTSQPFTPDYARSVMFTGNPSVNGYYQDTSFGLLSLSGRVRPDGDIYGWYTIPYDWNVDCPGNSTGAWTTAAETAARANGFDPSGYNSIVYAFVQGQCGWSGLANVGGAPARSWINSNTFHMGVVTHELGHNLGRLHASSVYCRDAAGAYVLYGTTGASCSISEYGDPFSVMGSAGGMKQHHAYHKGISHVTNMNWLSSSNTRTLNRTTDTDGTYTIAPSEVNTSGVQALRIPIQYPFGIAGQPGYYYLDFRQPMGYDNYPSTDPVVNGVTVRIGLNYDGRWSTGTASGMSYVNSHLIDMVPETTGTGDAPLTVGRTYTDVANNTTITVQSVGPEGATVRVQLGTVPCQNVGPTVTVSPLQVNVSAGQSFYYTVTLRNNDAADCGSSAYTITPQLPTGWIQTPSSFTETLAPGESITRTIVTSTLSTDPQATKQVSQVASRVGSTNVTGSATIYVNVQGVDVTPPAVNISAPADNATVKAKGKLNISANAYDNVGLATVAIYANTTLVKTCSGASTCSGSISLNSLPSGPNQIKAIATDRAGNSTTKIHAITKP